MIIKDNLLSLRGFRDYGYTPQSQSLLDPSSGYKPSATLLEAEKTYSQSLIDEGSGFQVDSTLARDLSTDTWSGSTRPAGTSSVQGESGSSVNWTGIINTAGGIISSFFQPKQPTIVYQQPKPLVPPWVLPAAIVGGAGLLAVAVLAKPKRSSLSGYSRRKRRSRKGRR